MNAVSLKQAINILPELVHKTIMNCEETVIVSDDGAVVLIDQREWESILETVRLLQDKISLKALLDGHKTRDTGNSLKAVTVQEAFYDLQSEYSEKCE
jgi:PHD/YefM family antitoxin component YafN of YafNO toxin-antitoxin module